MKLYNPNDANTSLGSICAFTRENEDIEKISTKYGEGIYNIQRRYIEGIEKIDIERRYSEYIEKNKSELKDFYNDVIITNITWNRMDGTYTKNITTESIKRGDQLSKGIVKGRPRGRKEVE